MDGGEDTFLPHVASQREERTAHASPRVKTAVFWSFKTPEQLPDAGHDLAFIATNLSRSHEPTQMLIDVATPQRATNWQMLNYRSATNLRKNA
jgi:hypothetical protein